MNQQIVVCSYNGIVLNNKSNDICKNMDESKNNYVKWEKLEKKEYTLYGCIYINSRKYKL